MGFQEKMEQKREKSTLDSAFSDVFKKIEGSTFFDEISTNYIGYINVANAAYHYLKLSVDSYFFHQVHAQVDKNVFDILINKDRYGKFCTGNF